MLIAELITGIYQTLDTIGANPNGYVADAILLLMLLRQKLRVKGMIDKPKLLDLFCGAGGASMGYYRAGFEVEGVDNKPQPYYPFKFYQADALEFPLEGYDAYHASPPCQAYVDPNLKRKVIYPKLISPIRERLELADAPFVIENVQKAPLRASLMLCGTMFGLPLIRHRYFECSFDITPFGPYSCNHWGTVAGGDFACVGWG